MLSGQIGLALRAEGRVNWALLLANVDAWAPGPAQLFTGLKIVNLVMFTSASSDVILLVRIFNRSASGLTTFVLHHQNQQFLVISTIT